MDGEKAQQGNGGDKSELYHAVARAIADADWEVARFAAEKSKKLKTTASTLGEPQDMAPAKRRGGGQPGNSNARKTGYHSAEAKMGRRQIRSVERRARAAAETVETFVLGPKKRGRPRKWW